MQLFSVGLWQLNMDGTHKLDSNGNPLHAYDSNDILNMARAWTGLSRAYRHRGNSESGKWGPHVDTMHIEREYRDIYPKPDILGGYIGDKYPLCVDLPTKDHLKKGASYRLLGGKSLPEMQLDHFRWQDNEYINRLVLEESSPLYAKLCVEEDGDCTFPGKVVLDANLVYENESPLQEFNVDTIRTLRIAIVKDDKTKFIHYEYIRPACVDLAFLGSQAKRVAKGNIGCVFFGIFIHDYMYSQLTFVY